VSFSIVAPSGGEDFVILDVIPDGSLRRHAAIARIRLADGREASGVFIVAGDPPERGARERPAGPLVAVWTGGFVRVVWDGARVRIIGDPGVVKTVAAGGVGCLAEAAPAWQVCVVTGPAVFAPLPR
jgi:hypothetical protein